MYADHFRPTAATIEKIRQVFSRFPQAERIRPDSSLSITQVSRTPEVTGLAVELNPAA
jgi:hypothetical protein